MDPSSVILISSIFGCQTLQFLAIVAIYTLLKMFFVNQKLDLKTVVPSRFEALIEKPSISEISCAFVVFLFRFLI